MIQAINIVKNPDEEKILRTPTMIVQDIEEPLIKQLAQDLHDTAQQHGKICVGLSANQIWKMVHIPCPRICIVRITEKDWSILINPKLEQEWKKEIKEEEGCMSIPGVRKKKTRKRHIKISFYTTEGAAVTVDLYDFWARIVQHELDHLNGVLIDG
jgi:peptide deformylase